MELIKDKIWCIKNLTFPSNTYLLKDDGSDSCLIIDPGLDSDLLDKAVTLRNLNPIAILATHGHFDHIGSVAYFKEKYDIPFYLHEADLKLSRSANFFIKMARIKSSIEIPIPDLILNQKTQSLFIGNFSLEITNYPGHSFGSCIIQSGKYLFSGDILYKKGLGFNNFPGEDKEKLKTSIKEIFASYSDDCLVLPGHGESERLVAIKSQNIELKKFLAIT